MFKAFFTELCNCACAKKIVTLIRICHTCVALKHKKADLSLEITAEISFEFIKFVKKNVNFLPLTKTNMEYKMFGNLRFIIIFDKLILPCLHIVPTISRPEMFSD